MTRKFLTAVLITLMGLSPAFAEPVDTTATQTLTNKTLTSPIITAPTINGTISGTAATQATGSTTARMLTDRFSDITNVKDYGAVGDGVTDDTAAFTAAMAVGGLIYVPAGTYIIDSLTVTTNCQFVGEGALSIIKKKNNSVGTSYADGLSYLFNITNANITVGFENLAFDGNYAGQVTTRTGATPVNTASGVQAFNGAATVVATGGAIKTNQAIAGVSTDRLFVTVQNCIFRNFVTIAIYFSGTVDKNAFAELTVRGSRFEDFAGSIIDYHDGVTSYSGVVYPASGYSFSSTGVQATGILGVDAARMIVTDNVFLDTRNPFAGTITTGYDMNTYNLPMVALTVTTSAATTQDDPLEWTNLIFTGNYIQGNGRSEYIGNGIGTVDFYARLADSVIANNTFRNNYSTAIRGKANGKGLTITGNAIENTPWSFYNPFGISIVPLTINGQSGDYVVSNNSIIGMAAGILVFGDTTPPEDTDANVADDRNDAQPSTALGATTNATGYAIGLRTVTLASAGTGTLVSGDLFTFAGDTTQYTVVGGDTDVSNGGTLTFTPGLVASIPAAATAITIVTYAKAVNNVSVTGNVIHNIKGPEISAGVLRTAFNVYGQGIYVKTASEVLVSHNIIDTTVASSGSTATEHGIYVLNGIKTSAVRGNIIRRAAANGIFVSNHIGQAIVSGNVVDVAGLNGISISNSGDNTVTDNRVNATGTSGIIAGGSGALSILASNNVITNVIANSASTVVGLDTGNATAANSIILTGNLIHTVVNAGAGVGYGMRVIFNATFSDAITGVVANNTIVTTDESGLFLQDFSGIVANNVFKTCNVLANTAHGAVFINGATNIGKTQLHGNTTDATCLLFPTTSGAAWPTVGTFTISAGVANVLLNTGTVIVDTEAAAATDDLDTLNGIPDGAFVTIRAASNVRDVVMKDGTGNMRLNGNFTLNNVEDSITLRNSAGVLYEVSRSDNGA